METRCGYQSLVAFATALKPSYPMPSLKGGTSGRARQLPRGRNAVGTDMFTFGWVVQVEERGYIRSVVCYSGTGWCFSCFICVAKIRSIF